MSYSKHFKYLLCLGALFLSSCGSYFNQPVSIQEARLGEDTEVTKRLELLPKPTDPIYVAVYKFRDQSGQYKPTDVGSTFSTAVTQGATSIVLKALEDSGYFIPVERENLNNLNTERTIINSTNQDVLRRNPTARVQPLDPLLYAGILIEGGIISYDSNIVTGGFGARYFGAGGSTQYRQDRVTVYLRAVATKTGKVLKTVYTSKTILSQGLDGGFFRYVKLRRLLEVESGFTYNEPSQLAVSEAIEKAVESLIIEGIEDGLWRADGTDSEIQALIDAHKEERAIAADTKLYNRLFAKRRTPTTLSINGGASIYDGDYGSGEINPLVSAAFEQGISDRFRFRQRLGLSQLSVENTFQTEYNDIGIDGKFLILPYEDLTPYMVGGLGYYLENDGFNFGFDGASHFKAQYGAGVEYLAKEKLGIMGEVNHNLVFTDDLDGVTQGKRDDHYFSLGIGVNLYLGKTAKQKAATAETPVN